jgi:hypothetical protein
MHVRKQKNKKHSTNKKGETKPHCDHKDDAVNEAHLLSDLRKPNQTEMKTEKDGQTPKKSKLKKFEPDPICNNATQDRQKRQAKENQTCEGPGRHRRQQVCHDTCEIQRPAFEEQHGN